MKTRKEIVARLLDSKKWLEIYRPEFLGQLNHIADDFFRKKTLEGYIASILIYHQITEEMIKALINISTFYIQSSYLDLEYKSKELDGKMFGQLIGELDGCLKMDGTNEFIQKCKEINYIRIKIVHKITKKPNVKEIGKVCNKSKKIFDKIYSLFDSIYDNWRVSLKDVKKDYECDNDS